MHLAQDGDRKYYFIKNPARPGTWYFHREDGPAIDSPDHKEWWVNGRRHRLDGPAVETKDVTEYWVDGYRHREDGPAVERTDGTYEYFVNGDRHRLDGPAEKRFVNEFDYNYNIIQGSDYEEIYSFKGKTFYGIKTINEFHAAIMADIIET